MSRRGIELYNYDKYQAYFPAPLVQTLSGDADEIIISADGDESSASGNTPGSITFNVSSGVWTNYDHVLVVNKTFAANSIATNSTGIIFSEATNNFFHATLDIFVSASDRSYHEQANIIYHGTDTTIRRGDVTNAGAGGETASSDFGLAASISNNILSITYTNLHNSSVDVRVLSKAHRI